MSKPEPNLFERPITTLCYCASGTSGGTSACAPCRERAKKAAKAAKVSTHSKRPASALMAWLTTQSVPNGEVPTGFKRPTGYGRPTGEVPAQSPDAPSVDVIRHATAYGNEEPTALTLSGYCDVIRRNAAYGSVTHRHATARYLGITFNRYVAMISDYERIMRVNLQGGQGPSRPFGEGSILNSADYNSITYFYAHDDIEFPLYYHSRWKMLLPAYEPAECACPERMSTPSGKSIDSCHYCYDAHILCHPETLPCA